MLIGNFVFQVDDTKILERQYIFLACYPTVKFYIFITRGKILPVSDLNRRNPPDLPLVLFHYVC